MTDPAREKQLQDFLLAPNANAPFTDVVCSAIHVDKGPGGIVNTLYLSRKGITKTGLFDRLNNYACSFIVSFHNANMSLEEETKICGITNYGSYVSIHFITPTYKGLKDIKTKVMLFINHELIDGGINYTFVKDNDQEEIEDLPVFNISQLAKQKYRESYTMNVRDFVTNFQNQYGSIIDVFQYNFAGFLRTNNFAISGITFDLVTCPNEQALSADEATNIIVKSIQHRIPLVDENSIQTLALKKCSDLDSKQGEEYAVINAVPQKQLKQLEPYFNPEKHHARTDKVPYLNLMFVLYDAAALPSQHEQNITPKLKVALFFAKFVISFDENTHTIVIEDLEKKENFLYQTFYDCDIYTVKKSDEIDNFLIRLAEFNCAWNCSQFYDEKNSNTGHYVISVLKYLNIWEPTALWAKFAVNVCERKPLEKHVTIYPDYFKKSSKNCIPKNSKECSKLKARLSGYLSKLSDDPFEYDFSGYSDNTEIEAKAARTELEFMCELLKESGKRYLRNEEDGVRAQRLLKKMMQTNYGQSLTTDTWQYLQPHNKNKKYTFHTQVYNFPNFFNLIKPNQTSELVEKQVRAIWPTVQSETIQDGY